MFLGYFRLHTATHGPGGVLKRSLRIMPLATEQ